MFALEFVRELKPDAKLRTVKRDVKFFTSEQRLEGAPTPSCAACGQMKSLFYLCFLSSAPFLRFFKPPSTPHDVPFYTGTNWKNSAEPHYP